MKKTETVTIELEDHFTPTLLKKVKQSFESKTDTALLKIVQAIILSKRHDYFEELNPEVKMNLHASKSKIVIEITGIPANKLIQGRLIKIKEDQIICGIRDILFSRLYPVNDSGTQPSSAEITEYVFNFIKQAGVLSREDQKRNPLGRIMIQGGHHIPQYEEIHHKRLGFGLGLLGFELITGSGPGSMEDPLKGAYRGYQMNDKPNRKFIGLTEDGIISGEPCNDYIDSLIVFPDIEKRLEAFIRMSRAGIVVPGGVGTFEEILTFLWIITHPANQDLRFPMYFCQPKQSGNFFQDILRFLETCFDRNFLTEGLVKFYLGDSINKEKPDLDPRRISVDIYEEMKENRLYYEHKAKKQKEPLFMLFNWDLYYPQRLQKALSITKPFVESLRFEKNMPVQDLFFSLRSLCSAIVEVNVRDRNFIDQNGTFKLKGDKEILTGLDELFEKFATQGRMGGRKYRCPYTIIN